MNIQVTARHFSLTEAIVDYAQRHLGPLAHLEPCLGTLSILLDHDQQHGGSQYLLKAHAHMACREVHAEVRSHDLYEGVDLLADKLSIQLRKEHTHRCAGHKKTDT